MPITIQKDSGAISISLSLIKDCPVILLKFIADLCLYLSMKIAGPSTRMGSLGPLRASLLDSIGLRYSAFLLRKRIDKKVHNIISRAKRMNLSPIVSDSSNQKEFLFASGERFVGKSYTPSALPEELVSKDLGIMNTQESPVRSL